MEATLHRGWRVKRIKPNGKIPAEWIRKEVKIVTGKEKIVGQLYQDKSEFSIETYSLPDFITDNFRITGASSPTWVKIISHDGGFLVSVAITLS